MIEDFDFGDCDDLDEDEFFDASDEEEGDDFHQYMITFHRRQDRMEKIKRIYYDKRT